MFLASQSLRNCHFMKILYMEVCGFYKQKLVCPEMKPTSVKYFFQTAAFDSKELSL